MTSQSRALTARVYKGSWGSWEQAAGDRHHSLTTSRPTVASASAIPVETQEITGNPQRGAVLLTLSTAATPGAEL